MAEKKEKDIGEVKLKNVRLSFAHLFEPQVPKPDAEGKVGAASFNANFLVSKTTEDGKANAKLLKEAKERVMKAKWPKGDVKLKPEKLCTRDGDLESYEGYEGHLYVSGRSPADRPPTLISNRRGGDGKWIRVKPQDGLLYSGCYVNAIVRLWAQDNEHGKRVNASIEAVQFFKHGDAFGAQRVDADEAFDDDDAGEEGEIDGDDEDGAELI